jgi:hypothetical protein
MHVDLQCNQQLLAWSGGTVSCVALQGSSCPVTHHATAVVLAGVFPAPAIAGTASPDAAGASVHRVAIGRHRLPALSETSQYSISVLSGARLDMGGSKRPTPNKADMYNGVCSL